MKSKTINASLKLEKQIEEYRNEKHKQQPRNAKYTIGVFSRTSKIHRIISKEEHHELEL